MKKIEMLKCYTINEMVSIISELSNVDTALDIINKGKRGERIKLKCIGNKLELQD